MNRSITLLTTLMRQHNFSAGPATLPVSVLQAVQADLLEWQGQGASILEVPHRSTAIETLLQETRQRCRALLAIPDHFHVLFMQGGARLQFAAVPLNLLGKNRKALYLNTGLWSQAAAKEAEKYGDIVIAASLDRQHKPLMLPARDAWRVDTDAAYFHYCDNETVDGIAFSSCPAVDMPLVADMSSSIFSKPIDWPRFGVVYAGMQKNSGPAGLSLVIVRDDVLAQAQSMTPAVMRYQTQVQSNSAFNTLPYFNIAVAHKLFEWFDAQGGVLALQKRNQARAQRLYDLIDASASYRNDVSPACRSNVNITFHLKDETLAARFLAQAEAEGLINLKGHSSCGGIRASLYNALPNEAVDALMSFMLRFDT